MAFARRLFCSLLYFITIMACLATNQRGHCGGGTWGELCKEQCPPGCAPLRDVVHCDKLNGECLEGCIRGLYGDTCATNCSTGCLGGDCDQFDGTCVQCKEGCFGHDCGNCLIKPTSSTAIQIVPTAPLPPRHACSNGTWGDKCDTPCSTHCIQYTGRTCNETTGVCFNDCIRGFYGERCDKLCSKSCENSVCQSPSGECVSCEKGRRLCGDVPTSNEAVTISLDGTVGYAISGILLVSVTIILIFQCRRHRQYRNRHTRRGETGNPGTSAPYPSGVHDYDVIENHRYWEIDESELEESDHRMSGAETHRSRNESAATPGYARPHETIMQNHLMDDNCARTLDKCVPLQSTNEYETVASFDNIVSDSSGMLYLRDNASDISVRYISPETTA